eukprot:1069016-Rhodomonas_salina.4
MAFAQVEFVTGAKSGLTAGQPPETREWRLETGKSKSETGDPYVCVCVLQRQHERVCVTVQA